MDAVGAPTHQQELEESFGPPIAAVEGDIGSESIYDTQQYEIAAAAAEIDEEPGKAEEKEEGEREDDEDEEGELEEDTEDEEEEDMVLVEEQGKEGPEVEMAIVGQLCSHPVHVCRRCDMPVLTAGRVHPCYHSYCLECAGQVKHGGSCIMYVAPCRP